MRNEELGAGRAKAIFALVFIAVVIYVGVKFIPVYVDNYQLNDYLRGLVVSASTQFPPPTVEGVRASVVSKARDLGLPVTGDDVSVELGHTVTISVDYKVPIDLTAFRFNLHFTPSAQNSKIL